MIKKRLFKNRQGAGGQSDKTVITIFPHLLFFFLKSHLFQWLFKCTDVLLTGQQVQPPPPSPQKKKKNPINKHYIQTKEKMTLQKDADFTDKSGQYIYIYPDAVCTQVDHT